MKLSERQKMILQALAAGESKKMIAAQLGVTRAAVEKSIATVRRKVNCGNVTHLVAFCIRNKYID